MDQRGHDRGSGTKEKEVLNLGFVSLGWRRGVGLRYIQQELVAGWMWGLRGTGRFRGDTQVCIWSDHVDDRVCK